MTDVELASARRDVQNEAVAAVARGVRYLCRLQDPTGVWSDFWLKPGASDAWVTAYVALSLHDAVAAASYLGDAGGALGPDSGPFRRARRAVERAAEALLAMDRPLRGWGYNPHVSPDADSTAHVLSLLARLGAPVPQEAVVFLMEHRDSRGWFSTYRSEDPANGWAKPHLDVTAAALRALYECGALSPHDLLAAWNGVFRPTQDERGWWHGYWWTTPAYTTGLVLEVWHAASRPPLLRPVAWDLPATCAFDLGWFLLARLFVLKPGLSSDAAVHHLASRLVAMQQDDGGWPAAPVLRVQPSSAAHHPRLASDPRLLGAATELCRDSRRTFATATAVRSLAAYAAYAQRAAHTGRLAMARGLNAYAASDMRSGSGDRAGRGPRAGRGVDGKLRECGRRVVPCGRPMDRDVRRVHDASDGHGMCDDAGSCDLHDARSTLREAARDKAPPARIARSTTSDAVCALLRRVAVALGFSELHVEESVSLLAALARYSLAEPSPWPSEQLSSLSGGVPIEFSAVLGPSDPTALRYALEVADPYLPTNRRAITGAAVLGRAARRLGCAKTWERVRRALNTVWRELRATPGSHLPPDLRFGIWGGVDLTAPATDEPAPSPKLKVYVNLLHTPASPALPRLFRSLDAAGIPCPVEVRSLLSLLAETGFPQELGFRLGPRDRWDCKVYFELPGWNRLLAQEVLKRVGVDSHSAIDSLVPEIPGVIRESLARKERSGILLRLDTATGQILEVTTAAAFPTPMHGPEEIRRRILAWAKDQGWSSRTYADVSEVLLQTWQSAPERLVRMHTLFTRTLPLRDPRPYAAVYLRPYLHAGG